MIFQMFPMSMHVFEPLSLLNNDPFPVMLEDADNSHVFAKENKRNISFESRWSIQALFLKS